MHPVAPAWGSFFSFAWLPAAFCVTGDEGGQLACELTDRFIRDRRPVHALGSVAETFLESRLRFDLLDMPSP
jgi:hypothetical protein